MSPSRFIPAHEAATREIEAFPYFAATYAPPLPVAGPAMEGDDAPLAEQFTTPEEDARRLASVDQQIHEKLQMAEHQAQEIARRAYEEGFAAGEAEGRNFGESQYKVYTSRLEKHLEELSRSASLLEKASKDEILALALAVGEYLAGRQIEFSRDSVRPLLEKLLERHPFPTPDGGTAVLEVCLNPRDLEQLGDHFVGTSGLRLVEDPELSRGSLRLSSPEGVVEATLERRRERVLELLHRFREERWA